MSSGSFDLAVVGTPTLIGDAEITEPAQLLEFPWLQELGTNEVGDWFSRRGVSVDRPLSISHMPGNLIMEAVCNGEGLTYTARQWLKEEIRSGKLIELFLEEAQGYFIILTQQGVTRPPVKTFVGWLKEQARAFEGA